MRYKDDNGAFVNDTDLMLQKYIIDQFTISKVNAEVYTVVPTPDTFDHADAEVIRNDNNNIVALIEAKFRNTDVENASHGLQIGIDKVVGIWDKYCKGWKEDPQKCKPIIALSGFYQTPYDKQSDFRVMGINLGHIHPYLYHKAKTYVELDGDNNYEAYRRSQLLEKEWQPFYPRVSWTMNTDQYPPKKHWCLWVPLDWCANVKPNFQLGEGISKQSLEWRQKFATQKFHKDADVTD